MIKHISVFYHIELNIVKTNSYITHRREHNSDLYSKRDEVEALLYKETDGSPLGSLSYYSAFEIKQLSKREKLKSKRDLNEIIKNVKKIMEIVWTYNFLSLSGF
jgi:hypothetical protein